MLTAHHDSTHVTVRWRHLCGCPGLLAVKSKHRGMAEAHAKRREREVCATCTTPGGLAVASVEAPSSPVRPLDAFPDAAKTDGTQIYRSRPMSRTAACRWATEVAGILRAGGAPWTCTMVRGLNPTGVRS